MTLYDTGSEVFEQYEIYLKLRNVSDSVLGLRAGFTSGCWKWLTSPEIIRGKKIGGHKIKSWEVLSEERILQVKMFGHIFFSCSSNKFGILSLIILLLEAVIHCHFPHKWV